MGCLRKIFYCLLLLPTVNLLGQSGTEVGDDLLPVDRTLLPPFEVDDPAVAAALELINAVSAYEVPRLPLKQEKTYAATAQDLTPYGGVRPFKEHFLEQMQYTGPGRSIPEPQDIDTVKIGFIGPIMSTVSVATGGRSHEEPMGIQMLQGCRLALEQANARGGYLKRNLPFELIVSNDNGLWGASGNEIVNMAYKSHVWAILGTIDGANSHIAIRVALKAEVPMMNSGDTDPSFVETNIPWVFRCIADDRQMGYLLVDYLYRQLGFKRIALIRSSNRYGRFGVREIRDASRRLGMPVSLEMAYTLGTTDFSLQLDRLRQVNPEVIVHWGDAEEGALILNQMRELGMNQPYFISDRQVSEVFVETAAANADGVMAVYPWNPNRQDPKLVAFKKAFQKRFGVAPGTYAAHGYDGMNMLIWATQVGGLNRAKIRDVLACRMKPWPGVTGDITLSAAMDDVGPVTLARFEKDSWHFYGAQELPQVGQPSGQNEKADGSSGESDR